jgi:hypothetical protein
MSGRRVVARTSQSRSVPGMSSQRRPGRWLKHLITFGGGGRTTPSATSVKAVRSPASCTRTRSATTAALFITVARNDDNSGCSATALRAAARLVISPARASPPRLPRPKPPLAGPGGPDRCGRVKRPDPTIAPGGGFPQTADPRQSLGLSGSFGTTLGHPLGKVAGVL